MIKIPTQTMDKIKMIDKYNDMNGYIGNTFQTLIESALVDKILDFDLNILQELNESLQTQVNYNEKMRKMFVPLYENVSINSRENSNNQFWNKVSNTLGTKIDMKILYEVETIEGDSAEETEKQPDIDENNNPIQRDEQGNVIPQITPEQEFQLNLAQTDQKFVTLTVFNYINELLNIIINIKENVYTSEAEDKIGLYEQLELYESYLEVLSDIIFVTDINTVYYTYCNIAIEINSLLDKYLISTKITDINSKTSSKSDKQNAIQDLIDNKESQEDAEEEML